MPMFIYKPLKNSRPAVQSLGPGLFDQAKQAKPMMKPEKTTAPQPQPAAPEKSKDKESTWKMPAQMQPK